MQNPKETLIKLLKNHDWWYMMSDDHTDSRRGYLKGQKEEEAINLLKKEVGEEEWKQLYNQYCPTEFLIKEDKQEDILNNLKPAKHQFVKRYGKDAELVMNKRAEKLSGINEEDDPFYDKEETETDKSIYNSLQGDRKPTNFADVSFEVDLKRLRPTYQSRVKKSLNKLNIINVDELLGDDENILDINIGDEQYGILKCNGEFYFYDSQGYDYPRYVTKLENFE